MKKETWILGKKEAFLFWLLFGLILLIFLGNGYSQLNKNINPADTDTIDYLSTSYQIKQLGGITHFIQNCFNGKYKQANQHPLYMLFLSVFAKRDIKFFVQAKILTFVIGIITIISFFWITSRLYNPYIAIVSFAFLTVNERFIIYTTAVFCESLLMLCLLWSWYFMMRGTEEQKYFLWAGFMCGLAYLTKGSGLFIIAAYCIGGLIVYRSNLLKQKYYWMFFVAFLFVSSPLLIRNVIVYDSPIYNDSQHWMWMDSWEQKFTPEFQEKGNKYNVVSYFRSHTLSEAGDRMLHGMVHQLKVFKRLNRITFIKSLQTILFAVLVALFFWGCLKESKRKVLFTLSIGCVFYLLFSWFSAIDVQTRYLIPLLPLFLAFSTYGCWTLLNNVVTSHRVTRLIFLMFAICLILIGGKEVVARGDFSNPLHSYHFKNGYSHLMKWLDENTHGSRIMYGPTHSYPFFYSKVSIDSIPIPLVNSPEELHDQIKKENIRYIFIDKEVMKRRKIISDYISGIRQLPPNWHIVYWDPSPVPDYVVIRVENEIGK